MHEYEIAALKVLKKEKRLGLEELQKSLGMERDKLMWAVENLKASGIRRDSRRRRRPRTP